MKNLALITILCFGFHSSFGQANKIPVTPDLTNTSTINQSGENGISQVEQLGTYNSSVIQQSSDETGNSIVVRQINLVGLQTPTYSEIHQSWAGSTVTVDQRPSLTGGNIAGPLFSYIHQYLFNNEAKLFQTGSSNYAYIDQGTQYSKAEQEQGGYSNIAIINQGMHLANSAYQFQYGFENKVEVNQGQLGLCQRSSTYQYQDPNSSENYSFINQAGVGATAKQIQSGQFNNSEIFQNGSESNTTQYQSGEYNNAIIYQEGSFSNVRQFQYGSRNNAEIEQIGGDAEQYQEINSFENNAYISQNRGQSLQKQSGYQNDAKIYQVGSYAEQDQSSEEGRRGDNKYPLNKATISQESGEDNYAYQKQFTPGGDVVLNEAILTQSGNYNHSEQYQSGQGNYSLAQQTGNSNQITVSQQTFFK